jgi:cytochrome c553
LVVEPDRARLVHDGIEGDPDPVGRVVALAFDPAQQLIVQTREPSMLLKGNRSVVLPGASRKHTGHELFHLSTAEAVTCASCHPEGQEDGHVWNFAGVGDRRTQAVSGGILGTEPFHWSGDLANFEKLVLETFYGRMAGPAMQPAHLDALAQWIDKVPRPKGLVPADPMVGCAGCHGGEKMTNNGTFDVETGGVFQVPSLLGLGFRAPYMHQGCAQTLADRFAFCGGGAAHGNVSGLTVEGLQDLIAYLDTL